MARVRLARISLLAWVTAWSSRPVCLSFIPNRSRSATTCTSDTMTILKGYYKNRMVIRSGAWIGQQCFLHSAGGLTIGHNVGIGPGVKIITSFHGEEGGQTPIFTAASSLPQ